MNILNYSWQDLAAGAVRLKSLEHNVKRPNESLKPDEAPRLLSANDKRDREVPLVISNPHMKKRKCNSSKAAQTSKTLRFSLLVPSDSYKEQGWIVHQLHEHEESFLIERIQLCQWVLERLQMVKNSGSSQGLKKPLILRHYGDSQTSLKAHTAAVLVNRIPWIPEVKQPAPAQLKLHYRSNDGSSFIYYPTGRMAVCQSRSGLSYRGFYTNVFSDSGCPIILATITASGRGTVTHPLSSTITAAWDQDGGFIWDCDRNISKEWVWQSYNTLKERVIIKVSDLISVQLFSCKCATLSFKCNNENVQLRLSALSNINSSKESPCLQTEEKFTSDYAQDLLLVGKDKSPVLVVGNKRNLMPLKGLKPGVLQMVREVQGLEEPSVQSRRGGHVGSELRGLQQRIQNILSEWLDYYRMALGIKCPDMEQMPGAPLRSRLRRKVQTAALPSLNPPEHADAKLVWPEDGRNELQQLHRHLSTPAQRSARSSVRQSSPHQKKTNEECHLTLTGPLRIYSNIKLK
ncbi:uncharacterized protein LOC115421412 [Sphaeramia orbicularis]|uniref:uncharacterized protein LOC115421412 n=1 Tax=Sphaeramia orbicularis TaxID=375764 RepID=UPI00117E0CDA|nr:uncharacterized protein C3orf20 homolog [Sphaeramia orbicularis]